MITVIKNYSIQDITDNIRRILGVASHAPEVRRLAIQITSDREDKITAICDWVKQHIQYVPDPTSIELFVSPIRIVNDYYECKTIGEDCDGHAILVTALYRSIGIDSHVVLIDSAGNGLDHAFSEVWSEKLNCWINVDTTSEYPIGWVYQYSQRIVI